MRACLHEYVCVYARVRVRARTGARACVGGNSIYIPTTHCPSTTIRRPHAISAPPSPTSGKKSAFEVFESHSDEVTELPEGGVLLAGNDHTRVQAMAVDRNGTSSWFVQYHPEYDLQYFSSLIRIRTERMTSMGFFKKEEDVGVYCDELNELHVDPARLDLLWKYGIDSDIIDVGIKQAEVKNWVAHLSATRR